MYDFKKIRERRLRLRKTQKEIAQMANMTREYYAQLEAGWSIPKVTTLEKLAKALKVKIDYFFENSVR